MRSMEWSDGAMSFPKRCRGVRIGWRRVTKTKWGGGGGGSGAGGRGPTAPWGVGRGAREKAGQFYRPAKPDHEDARWFSAVLQRTDRGGSRFRVDRGE